MKTQAQIEFEAFSMVPRCSFHNEKAIEYVINWAKNEGLEYIHDDVNGNVIIKVPAHPSKADHPAVILQGHLDMVPQVVAGMEHDFTKDPLDLKIKDNCYYAEGTTLGADDGVSVAYAFAAIKDKDIKNPPLEILFTTDEEVGMLSVKDADFKDVLKGKYFIGLDSEEEKAITLGCCGGHAVKMFLSKDEEETSGTEYTLTVSGLKGGHSGNEINQERGNAIKLLGAALYDLSKIVDFRIKSFDAPGKDNIICLRADAKIIAKASDENIISDFINDIDKKYKHIYRITDSGVKASVNKDADYTGPALTEKRGKDFINLLMQLPFGMLNRDQARFNDTETSANLGVAETTEKEIFIDCSIRSSIAERRDMVAEQVENLCEILGVRVEVIKEYPAWLPDFETELIPYAQAAFKKVYGEEAALVATHGGLECGFIMSKSNIKSGIDMGPTIYDIHSTNERLPIDSFNKTYDVLKEMLNSL